MTRCPHCGRSLLGARHDHVQLCLLARAQREGWTLVSMLPKEERDRRFGPVVARQVREAEELIENRQVRAAA